MRRRLWLAHTIPEAGRRACWVFGPTRAAATAKVRSLRPEWVEAGLPIWVTQVLPCIPAKGEKRNLPDLGGRADA